MDSTIAVLIPCYNESKTIRKVVCDFKQAVPEAEIYVFDNNSTDDSDILARDAGAMVGYEYKQGKGNVLLTMFRQINADCYLLVDGDDTYPAAQARDLISPILSGRADMVIGDRLSSTYFSENKRTFHGFGNRLVRLLINKIFRSNVRDIMTGYRAFNKIFVKNYPILSSGFEIETEMTIHALDNNFSITEVPITYRDRPSGSESKLNTFSDGFRVISMIFELFKRLKPLAFFGLISTIGIILSLVFAIPVFFEYLETGLVPRFPTLIASGILFTVSLLSLVCGIVLDTVSKNHKLFYELSLTRWVSENQRPKISQ